MTYRISYGVVDAEIMMMFLSVFYYLKDILDNYNQNELVWNSETTKKGSSTAIYHLIFSLILAVINFA